MMFHIFGNLLYSISLRFHRVTTLVSEEDIPVSLTDIEQAVAWHGGVPVIEKYAPKKPLQ